jgi:hypothetical protein
MGFDRVEQARHMPSFMDFFGEKIEVEKGRKYTKY